MIYVAYNYWTFWSGLGLYGAEEISEGNVSRHLSTPNVSFSWTLSNINCTLSHNKVYTQTSMERVNVKNKLLITARRQYFLLY
jgi:hypothetical protein